MADKQTDKQIVVVVSGEIKERLQQKCLVEKRSLHKQVRKLLEDFTNDEQKMVEFRNKYSDSEIIEEDTENVVRISVRIPALEYWAAQKKAADLFLTVKDFATVILKLWINEELNVWLTSNTSVKSGVLKYGRK